MSYQYDPNTPWGTQGAGVGSGGGGRYDDRYGSGPSSYNNHNHPLDDSYPSSSSSSSAMHPSGGANVRAPTQNREPWADMYDEQYDGPDTFDINAIDPALRLRTTKTAYSVIAESFRSENDRVERKRSRLLRRLKRRGTEKDGGSRGIFRSKSSRVDRASGKATSEMGTMSGDAETKSDAGQPPPDTGSPFGKKKKKPMPRRNIYVNVPLPRDEIDSKGEPRVRYCRNKVRTTKYTIVTFLPRNLFEQFRRVANVYFLGLVILQLFPIFGAAAPQIAMLPLVCILAMTAIKDAIEDWRRARLDEEVNTSAATKLGNWKNVNQPRDPRNFFERILHLGPNHQKTSRGVRKLRDAEAKAGKQIVMERQTKEEVTEEIQMDESPGLLQPPMPELKEISSSESIAGVHLPYRPRSISLSSTAPSAMSRKSNGVVDYTRTSSGTAQWERTLWKKLEVGDLVLLRDNEQIPADVAVLATSDADGLCFVETKNLDGETNLKPRRAIKATSAIKSEDDLGYAHFTLDSEPPHANLYSYNAVLRYRSGSDGLAGVGKEQVEPVTINEFLLRGCTLRNTKWVIGLVVFTGADTKIMLNGGDTPSKRSKIEKETNFNVIMNFLILMTLCLVTGIMHGYYRYRNNTSARWYEINAAVSANYVLDSVVVFVSSLIVFQNIVPISLYITIEIVKTIQAFFIHQDIEMYYAPYDTPCVPKTWNISDDLGQIEYVFSDKTGTLTQNVMEFKKCSIQGVSFGEGITEAMLGAAKREGRDIGTMEDQEDELEESKAEMIHTMKRAFKNPYLREDQLTLIAPGLAQRLADKNDPLHPHVVEFFRALALCHTVLSDKPEPEDKPFVIDYKAESPDEAALVAAARDVGVAFVTRNTHKTDIEVLGKPERWTPLRVLEFNSTRKRMSVITRSPDGKIFLYCKGADSVIYERLTKGHDEDLKAATLRDLETFANAGLRTLCIAYRVMSDQEFDEWSRKYDEASAAVTDREDKIDEAAALVEHDLTILGATALEDKLQEGVPHAIEMLHEAGIKLWILTGDKLQTAIEIGYSCNLLTNDMEVMIISADSPSGARSQIESGLQKVSAALGPAASDHGKERFSMDAGKTEFAVVIDGESLRYALGADLKQLFLSLGTQCAAVICCRVSPAQKAQTVRLVKDGCNAMTLSIGDGANDVAMIQEANIGVGLFGLEGSQAAMSADYAFGQFRFLTRLLLVHGKWSYIRIADMHANFFYKNVIWTISMFWFLIFNSFDATYLFQYTFVLLYNLVFTSLPVGILGAFDQDTNAVAAMAFPQLYRRGILGLDYTRARFWLYMLDGFYQSAVIFFIPFLVYWDGRTWSWSGRDTNDLYDFSSTVAASGVFAANAYVGINTRYWTIIPAIIIPLSILCVFAWITIYSYLSDLSYHAVVEVIFPTFTFWATVLFTVSVAVGPHWLIRAFRQSYLYRDKDIIREAWVGGDLKEQLGVAHRKKRRRKRRNRESEAEGGGAYHYVKRQGQGGAGGAPARGEAMSPPRVAVGDTTSQGGRFGSSAPGSPSSPLLARPAGAYDSPTSDRHTPTDAYPPYSFSDAAQPANPYAHTAYTNANGNPYPGGAGHRADDDNAAVAAPQPMYSIPTRPRPALEPSDSGMPLLRPGGSANSTPRPSPGPSATPPAHLHAHAHAHPPPPPGAFPQPRAFSSLSHGPNSPNGRGGTSPLADAGATEHLATSSPAPSSSLDFTRDTRWDQRPRSDYDDNYAGYAM